jgi:hypothetical protein
MKNLAGTRSWDKEKGPLDIGPQIQEKQSKGGPKETEVNGFGGSASADGIHESIAGLNAKAAAVFLIDLVG